MQTIYYWEDGSWCYSIAIDEVLEEGCSEDFEELLVPEDATPEEIDELIPK